MDNKDQPLVELGGHLVSGITTPYVELEDFEQYANKQESTNQKIYNKINKANSNIVKNQKQIGEAIELIEAARDVIKEQNESTERLIGLVESQKDCIEELVKQIDYLKNCDNTQLQAINAIDISTSKRIVKLYGFSIFVVALNLIEFFALAFHTGLLKF